MEYLGLLGLIAVGLTATSLLSILAHGLRKSVGEQPAPEVVTRVPADRVRTSTSRYFLLAVVGLALHAGAFYFYLWGASVRSAGLSGLLVMVVLGFCLITGVFYSWARGSVSYAHDSPGTNEASGLLD